MTTSELEYPNSVQKNVGTSNNYSIGNKKRIENHRKAAENFQLAAKFHLEAAKNHEEGNHEKAYQNTVSAHAFSTFANELVKNHSNQDN